jgi:hypothetical protein
LQPNIPALRLEKSLAQPSAVSIATVMAEAHQYRFAEDQITQRIGCGNFHRPGARVRTDVERARRQRSGQAQLRAVVELQRFSVDDAGDRMQRAVLEADAIERAGGAGCSVNP